MIEEPGTTVTALYSAGDSDKSGAFDDRRDPRHVLDAPATVVQESGPKAARIRNISTSGLCLTLKSAEPLPDGSGLALKFRLPVGCWVNAAGAVRWHRRVDGGAFDYGIEFTNLDASNRTFISYYIDEFLAGDVQKPIDATITSKYRVERDDIGRLLITLGGLLRTEDGPELERLTRALLANIPRNRLWVQVDARDFTVCSQANLASLRACFELISMRENIVGVLIGERSIATSQLLRAARESRLADCFIHFDQLSDVEDFWTALSESEASAA